MMTGEWAIFNDESSNWTEEESVEADFQSREEAEIAVRERYDSDDSLIVHEVEYEDGDEDDEEDD